MNNDGVPAPIDGVAVAAIDENCHGAAARRGGGGGGRFPGLRNRRFRAALYLVGWGVAGVISTTVPSLSANPDHVVVYLLLLIAGVLLLMLSMVGADLPWLDWAAARLEGILGGDMF